jgi:hypothetical protein
MKQLLFLLLFPCLALAQYTGNAGQKITLGEQTTADGLVFRGVANDTNVITPFSDTSAYIILDTVNSKFYHYNRTTTYWALAGGGVSVTSFSAGTTGLTPTGETTGAVTLGGTLAVANGGTNAGAFTQGSVVFAGASGTYTQDNSGLFYDNTNDRLGIGTASPNYKLHIKPTSSGRTLHDSRMLMTIESSSEAYYNVNIPSNGAGGFRVFATPASPLIDAAFEYWPFNDGNNRPYKRFHFYSSGYFGFNAKDNVERFRIDSTGYIGIGVIGPTEKLHVDGNARITAMNGIGDIGADANGVLQAATSDINLKNTIENSPFGLNEILLLNPVTFLYNDENRKIDSDVKEVGFIAQDVFDVIPNAVSSTGTGDLQLDYRAITATLAKAIQEQQALIKALEQRILILENK